MKMIKISIVFVCLMLGASCTLDLQQNPNAVDPSQAIPDLLLNSMQRQLAGLFSGASGIGQGLTRLQNSGGSTYANTITPLTFDGTWSTAYAGILMDGFTLIKQADKDGFARHAGMARVMNAYVLIMLVDMFGDVPYTKAFTGADEFNPGVDTGASVYSVALGLLDKGILDLRTLASNATPIPGYLNPVAPTPPDQYYYGNFGRWVRLANTLKLKAFLNLRLTDAAAATTGINAVFNQGLIGVGVNATLVGSTSPANTDNFTFHYGSNTSDPDARHPLFVNNYPAGGGNYMSNWLIWQMYHGYDAVHNTSAGLQLGDPRIRFYFYRQTNSNNTDPNNIRCATNLLAPPHYPQLQSGAITLNGPAGYPVGIPTLITDEAWASNGVGSAANLPKTFCYPTTVGYWGRDHVDNQGIPPDNFLRSAWGAYPAGGRFDGAVQTGVSSNSGMRGAGIQPIMMRAFTFFMLAEAAQYLGGVTVGTALANMEAGIIASFDDVFTFATTSTFGVQPAGPTESATITAYMTAYNVNRDAYRAAVSAAYSGATVVPGNGLPQTVQEMQMNIIAREYWVALYGNGVEAYNLVRRTGYPTGMQPTLQATVSNAPYPRSYYYPQSFATYNSTVTQKTVLSARVFWDNNTANLDY